MIPYISNFECVALSPSVYEMQISDSSSMSLMPSIELESGVPFPDVVLGELLGKGR